MWITRLGSKSASLGEGPSGFINSAARAFVEIKQQRKYPVTGNRVFMGSGLLSNSTSALQARCTSHGLLTSDYVENRAIEGYRAGSADGNWIAHREHVKESSAYGVSVH